MLKVAAVEKCRVTLEVQGVWVKLRGKVIGLESVTLVTNSNPVSQVLW